MSPSTLFALASVAGGLAVVLTARALRPGFFWKFAAVVMTVHVLVTIAVFPRFAAVWPAVAYLQLCTFVHFGTLVRARLRPAWWRALVQIPGMTFSAGAFLALPWAALAPFGVELPWPWLPFALAVFGTLESFWTRRQTIHLDVSDGRADVPTLARARRAPAGEQDSLRIVQITDPHLGPFMSPARLRRICERAVADAPDLIFVTGDLLTMESHHARDEIVHALAPLADCPGRVFACLGNHDYEALDTVKVGLQAAGARLLCDESAVAETRLGPVQIVGFEFVWGDRAGHMASVCAKHPRLQGHLRLLLLHDPGAFLQLPAGEGDLVLSGHTHGGQLGLVTLGLPWTFLSLFPAIPDHGLWARGRDRLYVHRGTGHYGFPIRLGVPAEESVLHVRI